MARLSLVADLLKRKGFVQQKAAKGQRWTRAIGDDVYVVDICADPDSPKWVNWSGGHMHGKKPHFVECGNDMPFRVVRALRDRITFHEKEAA
jgi:hypothetical protein